jgi:hypothetical protein
MCTYRNYNLQEKKRRRNPLRFSRKKTASLPCQELHATLSSRSQATNSLRFLPSKSFSFQIQARRVVLCSSAQRFCTSSLYSRYAAACRRGRLRQGAPPEHAWSPREWTQSTAGYPARQAEGWGRCATMYCAWRRRPRQP